MCGRFASTQTDADLVWAFRVEEVVGEQLAPSYNVAPTQPVRAVLERTPREEPEAPPIRQIRTARWGLIPSWAKDRKIGSRLINARAETITEKPSFKAAASRRRCIVPANGYFEWERRDGAKVPHYLHGGGVLGMAGLYELWPDPEREPDDPQRWGLDDHRPDDHGQRCPGPHPRPQPRRDPPSATGRLARPHPDRFRAGSGAARRCARAAVAAL